MPTAALTQRCLKLAAELLACPTAPLREELPKVFLRAFAARRPALKLSEDEAGNLLIKFGIRKPPLVLVAHLDHPGFWVDRVAGRTARLSFKGYVARPHAQAGARVRFFRRGQHEPVGAGKLVSCAYRRKRLHSATAHLTSGTTHAGDFAMWDFPACDVRNGLIVARGCDDQLGSAAALCAMNEIALRKPKNIALWCLFTRAEELGFLGALEALRLKTIPKDAAVLSLEASKALPNAPQGGGVIIRVGDNVSIFNAGLSEAMRLAAKSLAKKDRRFKFQRKLMDGGACEATPFCAWGYRASGVAVPLGNYHNMGFDARKRPRIGPETVRVEDFVSEVQLLVELALHPETWRKPPATIPDWIRERAAQARQALKTEYAPRWKGIV